MLADVLGNEPQTGTAPGPASSPTAASMSSRITVSAEPSLRPRRWPHHDLPDGSSRNDTADKERHRCSAPASHAHRGLFRSAAAFAGRTAGAFLLATLALSTFAPADAAPPGAPTDLRAETRTNFGQVTVVLSWTAPTDLGTGGPITRYQYRYKQPGDTAFSREFDLSSAATSQDFPGIIAGLTIQVRAVTSAGEGPWSAELTVVSPPGAPTGLRAETRTSVGQVRLTLSWSAPVFTGGTPITTYHYRYMDAGAANFRSAINLGSSATSSDFPESVAGQTYQIRAVNSEGHGPWSEEFLVPDPDAPAVTLVLTPNSINESGAGNSATLTATLSSAVSGSATTVTVGANPVGAVDLSGTTLTIPAGRTASSGAGITVTAVDNDADAPDAQVTISGTVAVVGSTAPTAPAGVTLTITDDDGDRAPPPPPPGGGGGGGATPANTPATGAPTITGTATVGQTLTAGRGTIADADGLTGASYAWQWVRIESRGAERAIAGATNAAYLITGADLGRTLKVRASFTDDAGNDERLSSAATATVAADTRTARVTTAVEGALAAVTRRAVSSALDTIGSRLTASMSASSLTLAGEAVSPGGAAWTAMAGLAPFCPPGAVDAHGVGTAFGAARFGTADGCTGAGRTRGLATADLLGGGAFSLTLGVAEGSAGFDPKAARWSLWGRGDLGSFEGRPESGMRYDGDLTTGWLGVDARAGAWVAGVAVSHGTGDATYAFEDAAAGASQGRLETSLTAIYPYGRWTVADGLELQAVLGAGQGEVRHGLDDDPEATSDLSMQMASIGVRHDLAALAGIDLAARADVHVARLETDDGPDYIHGLTTDSWRARAGLEASRHIVLVGDTALIPFVQAAARRDGGDGLEGSGLEVAGGLRYTAPRLELEARGRWLAAHSEDGAEEQGVSLTARIGPGVQGRGLSLALNPRWGAATGGAGALWREELPTAAGAPARAALDARVGYGVVLPPYGVLTPFARTGLADADSRRVGIGVRFAAPHLRFDVEVAGDHREGGAAGPEQVLGIDLGLQF